MMVNLFNNSKTHGMPSPTSFELTIILVPDKKTGQYTSFFAQFPEVVAIGNDEKEAQLNLFDIFRVMLEDKKKEMLEHGHLDEDQYISKQASFSFV
jgi:predicted RNase H-like HicB family nuclease